MAYNICKYGDGSGGGGGDERPDGSTVTPVSDIPTWLRCGGLGSKGYTTLSQVLDDSTTLDGLMSDANAVNYLVRSTVWISSITSNSNAMTYIGANDYAAYKLLSNSNWSNSICNSTYMELVLNVTTPTMTSDSTPSGKCSDRVTGYSNPVYYAFDSNTGTKVISGGSTTQRSYQIGYQFNSFIVIKKYGMKCPSGVSPSIVNFGGKNVSLTAGNHNDMVLGGYGDTTWYSLGSIVPTTSNDWQSYLAQPDDMHSFTTFRYDCLDRKYSHNNYYSQFEEIKFWGRIFGNVQSWLKAGKITDKTYTTLEQVLSDASTLQALMASTDAVDYLSACGNWASTICTNQSAMNYIGLNNYAANTLLADVCWCEAIANSQYINSVLNVKVPTMTSDTTPSGKCSCSHGNAQTWQAFDGNDSTRMNLVSSSISYEWVGYEFETPQSVRKIKDLVYGTINTRVSSAKLQYSSDGNTWNDIQTFSDYKNSSSHEYAISTSQTAKYWRIYVSFNAADFISYFTIQFYGRQDV